jgi:hypothetical protein
LEDKLEERGYLPLFYDTKSTAYYNKPTQHQMASYGSRIIQVVKGYETVNFRRMIDAGLSPNACNPHGESLLHMICRRGNMDFFQILLDANVDLQVADDYGRTPFHDCCWASSPSFKIACFLLKNDPNMFFLQDARGALPLSYVTKSNWGGWNKFIEQMVDELFPADKENKDEIPELCLRDPNTRQVPDPKNRIPYSLSSMVATGTMHPYEVMLAMSVAEDDATLVGFTDDDSSDESSSSSSDSEDDYVSIAEENRKGSRLTEETIDGVYGNDFETNASDSEQKDSTEFDDTSTSIDERELEEMLEYVNSLRLP